MAQYCKIFFNYGTTDSIFQLRPHKPEEQFPAGIRHCPVEQSPEDVSDDELKVELKDENNFLLLVELHFGQLTSF